MSGLKRKNNVNHLLKNEQ